MQLPAVYRFAGYPKKKKNNNFLFTKPAKNITYESTELFGKDLFPPNLKCIWSTVNIINHAGFNFLR